MKTLIALILFATLSVDTPSPEKVENACQYLEQVEAPSSNGEGECCYNLATIPGSTWTITYVKQNGFTYDGGKIKSNPLNGFMEFCVSQDFPIFILNHPEYGSCQITNFCFSFG